MEYFSSEQKILLQKKYIKILHEILKQRGSYKFQKDPC